MPEREPSTRPQLITHHATYDAYGRRIVPALCGAFIRRDESTQTPTCEYCRELMRRSEELQP